MRKTIYNSLVALFFLPTLLFAQYQPESQYLQDPTAILPHLLESADFWKKSIDREDGGFYTEVNQDGTPELTTRKSFVQCSRHAYGFSRAFMVSGDEEYLEYANHALDFVYESGWDAVNKGWFFSSDKRGNIAPPYGSGWNPNLEKWSFQQHYDVLGIGAMAEATRNSKHTEWLNLAAQTNDELLWDSRPNYLGYYDNANIDWSNKRGKGFTPTVNAITTWALTKVLLDDKEVDRARMTALANNIIDHFYSHMLVAESEIGFAEAFDANWNINTGNDGGSTGHVIKTAWCLARAYMLNPEPEYLEVAQYMIEDIMTNGGYDYENGGLYSDYDWRTGVVDQNKNHWMMEQGLTSGLINYFLAENQADRDLSLEMADGCMQFYMDHFIDEVNGECYSETSKNGMVTNADKSDPFKGGYHNIEMAYLMYVYGQLFLQESEVSLFYRFEESTEARNFKMTPLAIQDDWLRISAVELDGADYTNFGDSKRQLTIPAGTGGIFKITYDLTESVVATNDVSIQKQPSIFPNPAGQYFTIIDLEEDVVQLTVLNSEGKRMLLLNQIQPNTQIDISTLPSGIYFLQLQTQQRSVSTKLLKY